MDDAERERTIRLLERLSHGALDQLHAELSASVKLANALKNDFRDSVVRLKDNGFLQLDRREVVRCFGTLIDGYASAMRLAAVGVCELFDRPLNPFLQDKTNQRNLSTHARICTVYRLLAEFLPRSPFAHVDDERWERLHLAIEIRNRILHPARFEDLEIQTGEIACVCQTGCEFAQDFAAFMQWFMQKEQKLLWDLPMRRRNRLPKVGRNEKCPCGSQRKYKNCCAAAQYAA